MVQARFDNRWRGRQDGYRGGGAQEDGEEEYDRPVGVASQGRRSSEEVFERSGRGPDVRGRPEAARGLGSDSLRRVHSTHAREMMEPGQARSMVSLSLAEKLTHDPSKVVGVVFKKKGVAEHVFATLQCVQCENLLVWDPRLQVMICTDCGYELTAESADEVARLSQIELVRLRAALGRLKGRSRWDSVKFWLVRLLLGR